MKVTITSEVPMTVPELLAKATRDQQRLDALFCKHTRSTFNSHRNRYECDDCVCVRHTNSTAWEFR